MHPARHPSMTLIKTQTQGRFHQSLLAGAGSRGLKATYLPRWEWSRSAASPDFALFFPPGPACRLLTPRVHVDEARAWERGCVHKIVVVIGSRCVSHHPTQRFRCVCQEHSRSAADDNSGCTILTQLSAPSDCLFVRLKSLHGRRLLFSRS